MSVIVACELIPVALPARNPNPPGAGTAAGRHLLVHLTDDRGNSGWGEAPLQTGGGDSGRYYGETLATGRVVLQDSLIPAVLGCPSGSFAELHTRMDRAIAGYPGAKAALDGAAYDLTARRLGVPLWQLLGGKLRSRLVIAHPIGRVDVAAAIHEAMQVAAEGIRTLKIAIGVEPMRDIEMVHRIREAVGPQIVLTVDAAAGYATPGEAIRALRVMERYDLRAVEQPVEGIERMAEVARAIDTPVVADESAWTARDLMQIAGCRAAQMVTLNPGRAGGLYRALEMAAVARTAGLACAIDGGFATGIGALAGVQIAAAIPAGTLPCTLPAATPAEAWQGRSAGIVHRDDVLAAPIVYHDGLIGVPDGTGLGLPVDRERVERFRVEG